MIGDSVKNLALTRGARVQKKWEEPQFGIFSLSVCKIGHGNASVENKVRPTLSKKSFPVRRPPPPPPNKKEASREVGIFCLFVSQFLLTMIYRMFRGGGGIKKKNMIFFSSRPF